MAGQWQHTPLITAFRRQMQAELYVSKASLVYGESSRTASGYTEKPQLEKKNSIIESACMYLCAHTCTCVCVCAGIHGDIRSLGTRVEGLCEPPNSSSHG